MKKLFTALLLLTGTLFLAHCSKEGPAGPIGPAGIAGVAGQPGATGATGTKGETGTANVIYSSWIWPTHTVRDTTIDASKLKITHLQVPRLSQAIADNGTVLVYFKFGAATFPLPYTSHAGSKPSTLNFLAVPGKLFISRFTHDNSGSVSFGALQFRYILIPGGVAANRTSSEKTITINNQEYTIAALQAMPFEEAAVLLGIPNED